LFKFMGNKRLLFLMLALILFFILMGLTLGGRAGLTWPEKFVKDTVSWTQALFYKPAAAVAGFFEDIGKLRVIYEENRTLKMTLTQYARDTQRLNDLEAQNKRLKEQLDFTEHQKQANDYKYRIAEVVAANTVDPYTNTLTINLGERDGIKKDMAVVTIDGLIGRVQEVAPFTSTVQLLIDITDSDNSSKAIVATAQGKENDSFGVIESYEKGLLAMTRVDPNDPIAVGDTVITSNYGLVFPGGIPIGKVVSRDVGDFGITHKVMVEPFASFNKIREVFVVEAPGRGEP